MATARFEHEDGRTCMFSEIANDWFHWDGPEDGPMGSKEHRCTRPHPGDSSRVTFAEYAEDRGEFGLPMGVRVIPGVTGLVKEMKGYTFDHVMARADDKVSRICNIMDEAQTLYKTKAAGYKGVEGDTADHLGAKGQFADISRKFWRLKAMLWDEVVPMYPDAGAGESVEEILMDFIGHAALTIDYLRQARGHGEEAK